MGKKKMGLEKEYKETAFEMTPEEKEYFDKFNREWIYGPSYSNGESSIKDEEFFKEAHRNKNMRNRDAYIKSEAEGMLTNLSQEEAEFMEAAHDAWDWQRAFKYESYEAATEVIFKQAIRDIEAGTIDLEITLSRFLVKILELRKLHLADPNKRKQDGYGENDET